MSISFRRLRHSEIPLIHRWLHTPHVARWWYEDVGTLEEVGERYSSYIEGRENVEAYLILFEGSPIGYMQTYSISIEEEYERLVGVEDAAGVDLFIGEEEFLYRGLGASIIRRFLRDIVFSDERYEVCIIGPEPGNKAAIRAYEKVGFRYFKTMHVPGEPEPEYLMKLTRKEFFEGWCRFAPGSRDVLNSHSSDTAAPSARRSMNPGGNIGGHPASSSFPTPHSRSERRRAAPHSPERSDAIVIGSGHNGLITAAYLAKAGKKVLVLERREVIGGATVTEEFWPGYKLSTCSYVCSLLLPEVIKDLELVRHGYDIRPLDPQYFTPFPDGRTLTSHLDGEKTKADIRRFSKRDADNYDAYWKMWDRIIARMRPLMAKRLPTESELEAAFDGPEGEEDWRRLTKASVAELLDEFFESEEVKAPLSVGGVIGTNAGPRDAGTAYIKFHHILGSVGGHRGAWGYVRGGMGMVAESIASSAREHGAEILTDTEVERVEISDGEARAVTLRDGRSFETDTIISNADPHRTFSGMVGEGNLPDRFSESVRNTRTEGSVVKVLLGLGELPDFAAAPGKSIGPHHKGAIVINPSIDYLQAAWEDAKEGRPSERPFMEGYIQSATESGLAPPGKHTMSLFCQYAPYELAEGTWDGRRDEIGERIIDTFAEYAPNLPDAIEHIEVLGPPDIEARVGISGGNIFHGEMTPDRMFGNRPAPGFVGYESPIKNLYLCGAGMWPGGAVFGAAGRNCAMEVIASGRGSF